MRKDIIDDSYGESAPQSSIDKGIISVGVTTYNNKSNISNLLDSLSALALAGIYVFLYDDCSTDGTVEITQLHPISSFANFRLDIAAANSGGPLAGRKAMAKASTTEYITFIDGDDELNANAFLNFVGRIPSGKDMVMTPYRLYGKDYIPTKIEGDLIIDNSSVTLAASGVGGRIYRVSTFLACCPSYYVPRAEDAHVNLAILGKASGEPDIFVLQGDPFYIIHAGTKSKSTSRIVLDELQKRRQLYEAVKVRFRLGNEYLLRSKAFLLSVINGDKDISYQQRRILKEQVQESLTPSLERIVLVCNDPSVLGGVASRVNLAMAEAKNRQVEYRVLSLTNLNNIEDERYFSCSNLENALEEISRWDRASTAIVVQAAIVRSFPEAVRRSLDLFPIVYYGDAQTAALLQTNAFYQDKGFFDTFKASSALALSDADISFQQQLGVYGQKRTVLPVVQREQNTYRVRDAPVIGYVGVSDFRFKATDRIIDVAIAARRIGLPPIHIFTSDAKNSPDFNRLIMRIREGCVDQHIVIHLNEQNKDNIFGSISVLYVPSKNEAGGTVVLEALSYGVPVAGHSYAPAVKEAITDGLNGFVFEIYDPDEIAERIARTAPDEFRLMSSSAFNMHRNYSPAKHLGDIEAASNEAISRFAMKNEQQVFPRLEGGRPTIKSQAAPAKNVQITNSIVASESILPNGLQKKLRTLEKRVSALERSLPIRLVRKFKWLKKYTRISVSPLGRD